MNFDSYDQNIKVLAEELDLKLANKDKHAVKLAEDLIISAFSAHDKALEGYARYKLALCYYRLDFPEEKIREALNKAIIFLTPTDNRALIASAYNMLGILESINNRQNLSMDYFITALNYCDDDNDELLLKRYNIETNISYLYYSSGEISYAIALTSDTINALTDMIFLDDPFRELLFRLYCVIGIFYCKIDEQDLGAAEKYLKEASEFLRDSSFEIAEEKLIVHTSLMIMINFMSFDKDSYDTNISVLLKQIQSIDSFTDYYRDIYTIIDFLIVHEEYYSAGKILDAVSERVEKSNFLGIHVNFDELMINYLEGSGMEQQASEASHRYYKRIREKKPGDIGAMLYSLNLRREMQHLQIEGEQLKYAAIREKAANEAKTSFLSNMSHELRTPINAILGMDEMILRESRERSIVEYADNIRNAGNSLLSIINDILDFSKIEADKMDIIPAEYHFSELLNSLMIMLQPKANDKNLYLDFKVDESIPDRLYGDEMRIRQVLINLVNNGIKYTEKGGITVSISFEKHPEDICLLSIHVQDTGIGIKKEDFEKLFSPFERIDLKKNKNIEGTGLGISITTKLLKLMSSELKVDSEYTKGSDFHFNLAQKVISWDEMGDFKNRAKELEVIHTGKNKTFVAPSARVLVVDDTEMNLIVIKNLLKRTEIQVDTALSGSEALEMIENTDYDLIFMDHRMPIMDGVETLGHIKERPEGSRNLHTPEVMLTADAIVGMAEKFIESGFDHYLAKPVNSSDLESTIIKFLSPEKIVNKDFKEKDDYIDEDYNLSRDESEVLKRLKAIEILDSKSAITACGDVSTFLRVARSFFESSPVKITEIVEAIEDNDTGLYTIKVHALKSSARLCGLNELSKTAAALEDVGNELKNKGSSFTDEIIAKSKKLLSDFDDASVMVQKAFSGNSDDDSSKEEISLDELQDAYRIIYEYNNAFDVGSIDDIMKRLEAYKIPDSEKDRFRQLKQYVNEVNNDGIANLLEQIMPLGGLQEE